MADIVEADVVSHYPAFADLDAAAITDILAYANLELDVLLFGGETASKTKLARVYLCAHVGTMMARSISDYAGPVASEKAGDLSRSYGGNSSYSPDGYSSTAWGRMYQNLCKTTVARLGFII